MSLKTWKKEFYPKPANKTTKAEALEHSIKKWEGATNRNLRKHGLERDSVCLDDNINFDTFCLDGDSCALCYHFFTNHVDPNKCNACPLYKVDNISCSETESPYTLIEDFFYPVSTMIKQLKKARKFHHYK